MLDFRHHIVQISGAVFGFDQFVTTKRAFKRTSPARHNRHHARIIMMAEQQPAAVRIAVEIDVFIHLHAIVIGPRQGIDVLDQWSGWGSHHVPAILIAVHDAVDAGKAAAT